MYKAIHNSKRLKKIAKCFVIVIISNKVRWSHHLEIFDYETYW